MLHNSSFLQSIQIDLSFKTVTFERLCRKSLDSNNPFHQEQTTQCIYILQGRISQSLVDIDLPGVMSLTRHFNAGPALAGWCALLIAGGIKDLTWNLAHLYWTRQQVTYRYHSGVNTYRMSLAWIIVLYLTDSIVIHPVHCRCVFNQRVLKYFCHHTYPFIQELGRISCYITQHLHNKCELLWCVSV